MTLYIVEFDGGMDDSRILGIYDSKEKAEKRRSEFPKAHREYYIIWQVQLNQPIG